jgi:hypothetical protein
MDVDLFTLSQPECTTSIAIAGKLIVNGVDMLYSMINIMERLEYVERYNKREILSVYLPDVTINIINTYENDVRMPLDLYNQLPKHPV